MMQNKEHYEINGFNIEFYKIHNIFIINNMFDTNFCNYLVNEIEINKTRKMTKTNYNNVECYKADFNNKEVEARLTTIAKILSELKQIPITGFTEPEYRKVYGKTHLHADGACVDTIADPNTMCKIKQVRSLTFVCALNDGFEGGVHKFPELDFEIKLGKGCLIAFPPYWTHKHLVTSVENNTFRYTISCWALDNYLCNNITHGNLILL